MMTVWCVQLHFAVKAVYLPSLISIPTAQLFATLLRWSPLTGSHQKSHCSTSEKLIDPLLPVPVLFPQPLCEIMNTRDADNEALLGAIFSCNPNPSATGHVVDARHQMNALANKVRGGGYETAEV